MPVLESQVCNFIKKTPAQLFFREIWEIFLASSHGVLSSFFILKIFYSENNV